MRIISILVMLELIWVMIMPQKALATETNTDETKINFKIQDNLKINQGKVKNSNTSSILIVDTKLALSEEEQLREAKLARYKDRLDRAILPKGQFIVNASAYTAAADECGKSDGITASGVKVKVNRTLACPPQFPFGVKIKIEGMGTYVCEDRGGAIKGNHVDIYMQTKKEAFAFGRKNLLAEVVK
jgi:3D (Asp-Asp-Asp) domain-containing protein